MVARTRLVGLTSKERERIRDDFTRHVQETNSPETYPGVTLEPASSRDAEVEPLREFSVVRSKRLGGEMVPCSFCSPGAEKFLHNGWLAYFPEDKMLRLLGPRCGSRHLTRFDAAVEKHLAEFEDDRKRDYVRANAVPLQNLLDRLPALKKEAENIRTFLNILQNKVPDLLEHFRNVTARHTDLTVPKLQEVVRPSSDPGVVRRDQMLRQVKLAELFGKRMFRQSAQDAHGKFERARAMLAKYTPGEALRLIRQSDENISAYPVYWKDAVKWANQGRDDLIDAATFFSPHSVRGLDMWARDPDSPFPYSFSIKDGYFEIWHEMRGKRLVHYQIPDAFLRTHEPLPEMIHLHARR